MKKQSKQILLLTMLLIAAAAIWNWNEPQNRATSSAVTVASTYQHSEVGNLGIRWSKIETSHQSEYKGERNIFSDNAPTPMVKKERRQPETIRPVATVAPELPMKFFGYGTVPNGTARRAFLSDGDDVYVVSEGDTILGRYRILKIGNAALEFEEIPSGLRGKTNFEDLRLGS